MCKEGNVMLSHLVISNWEEPNRIICDCIHADYKGNDDANDVMQWIEGKRFSGSEMRLLAESQETDEIMPFLYVKDDLLPDILGIYLLILDERFLNDFPVDFAVIHYSSFVKSENFFRVFKKLNSAQKWISFIMTKKLVALLEHESSLEYGYETTEEDIQKMRSNLDACCYI